MSSLPSVPKGSVPAMPAAAVPKGAVPKGAVPKGSVPKGSVPAMPAAAVPKGVVPKGVQPKKSEVVKLLPSDLRESFAAAAPSLLRPIPQPFQGITIVKPLRVSEEKKAEEEQANPLLHPDQRDLKKKKSQAPSSVKPIVAPKVAASTSLRLVSKTINMVDRDRSDVLDTDVEMDLDEIDPLFAEFRERQDEIESENPYQLETEIYTPITRRSFYKFIHDTYSESFKILPKPKGPIDENACQTIEDSKRLGVVEAFSYQKFITEYLRQASPFRGLLVYHGLGSGKTCSAIAAAEALYGTANKRVIVMTPFSLRPNFISEISFCGFRHFNVNNHWVSQPITTEYESAPVYMYGRDILSLPEKFLDGVLRRPEEERRVLWIPDFDKPANFYDDEQITAQDRIDIRLQINAAIENRITFISYNGIPGNKLKEYACSVDADGNKFFDNAVIVIDEVHNLIRLMQGNIVPYITKRSGRERKIPVEPIVPGRWKPSLCDRPANYKRAYLFYRLLSDARNSKIIGLSGTPIINFPEELGILANVLAGYMECAKFVVDTTEEDDLEAIKELCEEEPRVDIVRYEKSDRKAEFLVSVFNEGYIREDAKDEEGEYYVGVQYTEEEEGQESIQTVFPRIKQAITDQGLASVVSEQYVSYPRLPVDDESFRREFIHPVDLSIRNRLVLQKRITGLISYYAANNEAFMPRVAKDEFVRCEMSDYVLGKYSQARKAEMEGEANKKKEPGDVFSAVEMFAKMKNPSSYRFRSRALCNFAFPESIERPFPGSEVEEAEADQLELGEAELAEIIEIASADPLNDQIAVEEVMREEELAEDPELPAEPAEAVAVADAVEEKKQEGGAGEGPSAAPVPAKPSMTPDQARARLAALRAAKEKAAAAAAVEEKQEVAPSQASEASKVVVEEKQEAKPRPRPVPATPAVAAAPAASVPKAVPVPKAAPAAPAAPAAASVPKAAPAAPAAASVPKAAPAAPAAAAAPKKIFSVKPPVLSKPIPPSPDSVPAAPPVASVPKAVPAAAAPKKIFSVKPPVLSKPIPPGPDSVPATPAVAAAAAPKKIFSVKPPVLSKPIPPGPDSEPAPIIEEAVKEAVSVVPARRLIPYRELIQIAMRELEEKKDVFLNLDPPANMAGREESRLAMYSTKLDRMLRNIMASKGSNLVYSQFKTVEGLGVLGLSLKANGFQEIVVQGSDADPYFAPETVESLRKGPAAGEKRFILFTGEGSKDRRGLILNIFNGNLDKLPQKIQSVLMDAGYAEEKNIRGAICWVIGITGAGAEGISLKCCRSVHIMESYWNNVRLDQVKGRAIRICSHTDLPYQERDVDIYTYCTVFSEEQKRSKIDITLKVTDNNETSDERVYNVSIKKDKINQAILQVMKEAAVDCGLNSADIGDVQCLRIDGRPDQYLFDPDLEVDKRITGIQFKQVIQKAQQPPLQDQQAAQDQKEQKEEAVQKALSQPSKPQERSRVAKMEVQMIRYDGKPYLLLPYPSDSQRFKLYSPLDELLRKQLGELEFDPITKRPSRVFFYPSS